MLARLDPELLDRLTFPLGALTKDAVRGLAREAGLPVADKRESQDLCFVAGLGGRAFLQRHGGPRLRRPGEIVDRSGTVLGRHDGQHNFTVGQRRGVGVAVPGAALRARARRGEQSRRRRAEGGARHDARGTRGRPPSPDCRRRADGAAALPRQAAPLHGRASRRGTARRRARRAGATRSRPGSSPASCVKTQSWGTGRSGNRCESGCRARAHRARGAALRRLSGGRSPDHRRHRRACRLRVRGNRRPAARRRAAARRGGSGRQREPLLRDRRGRHSRARGPAVDERRSRRPSPTATGGPAC